MKYYLVKIKKGEDEKTVSYSTLREARYIWKRNNYKCINCMFGDKTACSCKSASIYLINEKCIQEERMSNV